MRKLSRVALPERIANDLRRELQDLKAGTKIPTEPELAKRYGVSVPTLRIAVSVLVQEGLVIKKHGSGTYVASRRLPDGAPDAGNRRVVGLPIFLDCLADPGISEFWFRLYYYLISGMEESGIAYRILPIREHWKASSPEFLHFVESQEAAAMLVCHILPHDFIGAVEARNLPSFGLPGTESNLVLSVGASFSTMVKTALDLAKKHGRQRVAMLAWNPGPRLQNDLVTGESANGRLFSQLVQEAGLATRDHWVCCDLHPKNPAAGWGGFREVWSATSSKPDALLVCDSQLMPGVIDAARDSRIRIPEDILVISHSNSPESVQIPPNVVKIEYHISDISDPLLDGLRAFLRGEEAEAKSIEISPSIIEAIPASEEQAPSLPMPGFPA